MDTSGFTLNGIHVTPTMPKLGTTSGAGNGGGTTLVDANGLTEGADYWKGTSVLILSGACRGQTRPVTASAVGSLTVAPAFTAQIASGVQYVALAGDVSGHVYNRVETLAAALAGGADIIPTKNELGPIDKGGGRLYASVGFYDRVAKQLVPSADINLAGATGELFKSTGDAAFSVVGITQPVFGKATGLVEAQDGVGGKGFAIVEGEWQAGDQGLLLLTGLVGTDADGDAQPFPPFAWPFQVVETLSDSTKLTSTKTTVEDIDTDLGEPSDLAVDPSGAAGSVHAKLRGAGDQLDTILANLATVEGYVDTEVAAIKARTDNLPADPAAQAKLDTLHDTRIPGVVEPQSGDSFSRLGAPAGATVSADVAAIKTVVDAISGYVDTEVAAILAAVDTEIAAIKAKTDNLPAAWVSDAYATHNVLASTETDIVAQVSNNTPSHVIGKIDLTNLTQDATIKVYHAMGTTGTTLRAGSTTSWAVASDPKVVEFDFWANGDYKLTLTTGAEGTARDVYVRHARKVNV